jgi:predicted ATP-dependent endonuclease of OLD family
LKIDRVEIWNLRAFEHVDVPLNDYACLVGPNGAGKSTVLCALNIFFRQTEHTGTNLQSLDREDFFRGNTENPIRIRVTFGDLETEAEEEFKHYVRASKLIVTAEATFDEVAGRAVVKHYGERMGMEAFAPFFEQLGAGASAAELGEIYERLREKFSELPKAGTKDARINALRAYESDRPDECVALPSPAEFYGVSKGANRLERFVQWVYVPAVKDAIEEQSENKTSALGKLLARTVRARTRFDEDLNALREETRDRYQRLLDDNQTALNQISEALNTRLAEWAHSGATLRLEWQEDRGKSVVIQEPWAHVRAGEGAFESQLSRLGHGLQRSYIIALLQELALYEKEGGPKLLLAIEEPELYQHPPQARHLAAVLIKLASAGAQVMVSTHSPFFVSGSVFEDVRVVRRPAADASSTVRWAVASDVSKRIGDALGENYKPPSATVAKLQQILQPQLAEIFFASKIVLVEGREDVAFVQSYLELKGLWDEFRKLGCHIVAADGKDAILRPLIVAQETGIPCFVICDADSDCKEQHKHHQVKDNCGLLKALGSADLEPFSDGIREGETYLIWPNALGKSLKADVPEEVWAKCLAEADLAFDQGGTSRKNVMHIAVFVERLWAEGQRPASLEKIADKLLAFAKLASQ